MPKRKRDFSSLTILGREAKPSKKLETFPNRSPRRYYLVTLETNEFTCICPLTGQPDFATIKIEYIPDKKIVESKSLKMYLWSFRSEGHFHEHVINIIIDDFIKAVDPHWCKITGVFNVRGGIGIRVDSEHINTPEAKRAVFGN